MDVLITGAGSFLGKLIIPQIAKSGFDITAVWRNRNPFFNQIQTDFIPINLIQGDLADYTTYKKFPNRIDAIIHVAAVSANVDSAFDFVHSNIIGMKNLIEYATNAQADRFIYLSSLSIHGCIQESIVTENTPIINPTLYGISKYVAEILLCEKNKTINSVALRLPGVLGFGAHRHWLSTVLMESMNNDDIFIFNPDALFNNAVHANDLADFIVCLLSTKWTGFQAMPIGAEGHTTIKNAVNQIITRVKSRSKVIIKNEEKSSFSISSKYAINNFNYKPMDIKEMINKYVDENINNNR